MTIRLLALMLVLLVGSVPSTFAQAATQEAPTRRPDVIFVPTPEEVVEAMLQVANVTKNVSSDKKSFQQGVQIGKSIANPGG